MTKKICVWCGKEFDASDCRKACSPECRIQNIRAHGRENARKRRNAPKTRFCEYCGKEFTTNGNKLYCNIECREAKRIKDKMGYQSKKPVVSLSKANINARNKGQSYGQYVASFYAIGQETIEQKLKRRRFQKMVEAHERACD